MVKGSLANTFLGHLARFFRGRLANFFVGRLAHEELSADQHVGRDRIRFGKMGQRAILKPSLWQHD